MKSDIDYEQLYYDTLYENRKLKNKISELEIELQREESEPRKMEIEKEILFKSENPDLKLNDYFELDILIQEMIEKRLGK